MCQAFELVLGLRVLGSEVSEICGLVLELRLRLEC